jgi:hypothetical protein
LKDIGIIRQAVMPELKMPAAILSGPRQFRCLTLHLGGGLCAGFSIEGGGTWAEIDDIGADDLTCSESIFFGAESLLLGPFDLGLGVAEKGAVGIYLQLSPLFHQGRIGEGALRTAH